VKGSENKKA